MEFLHVIRRRDAVAAGLVRYFTGKLCQHGHSAERFTSTGGCSACCAARSSSPEKRAYDAERYAANRDEVVRRSRDWRMANPGQHIENARRWNAQNPDKRRVVVKSHKARRRAVVRGGDSTALIHAWESSAEKVCRWCSVDCSGGYHVDHVMPLALGGRHEVANLAIACPSCNLRKNAKHPKQFAREIGVQYE